MFLFVVSSFFSAAASILLGIFVLLKNWRSKINILWFLTTLSISIWAFSLGMEISSPNYNIAFLWNKILNIGAIFIPIFFYHFVSVFLEIEKKEKILIISGYFFSVIVLFFFNIFTPFFVKGVPPKAGFEYWIEVGPLYYLFFLFFVAYILRTIYLLFKYRRIVDKFKKFQINYLLIAIVFGFGGGITNFFPQVFNVNIFPIGNYLVALYAIFITYALLKHHLFNTKIIITELFTLGIWMFLLVRTILSETWQNFVVNGGLLLAMIFFGTLLVRSVWKEVRQREKMEVLTKKVQRAYEVEKRARKELNKLDEVKNQFIMASQHHLRTPLTSMRGYLELLLEGQYGKISPQVKEVLRRFNLSSERLIKIVNEFLDITQFQLGKEVIMPQPGVDLEPIFKEIVEELGMETKARGLYLRVNKPKRLPKIKADSEKLKIALFNIVDNAIKYTRKGGITINIKKTDSKVQITVKDTGVGIPKEQQKGLFNKLFVRGKEATKLHGTGRGIGLYIAYHIIKAHNGKIWVESEGEGKGTIFFIELPIS